MEPTIFLTSIVVSLAVLIPLGMKWEIDKKLLVPSAFGIGAVTGALVNVINLLGELRFYQVLIASFFLVVGIAAALLLWRFYRNPERVPPGDEDAVVSPADGRIIYIKEIRNGEIPFSEKRGRKFSLDEFVKTDILARSGRLVGIMMSYLDVHMNRAPIDGKLVFLKHIKGLFVSLKKKEAVIQNERVLSVIRNTHHQIGMVQIASRLVRKIVPYVAEGDEVRKGQRIGVIRFGSQVDLILPDLPSLRVVCRVGDKVKAGESIVARFESSPARGGRDER